jgi:hypothetical protein
MDMTFFFSVLFCLFFLSSSCTAFVLPLERPSLTLVPCQIVVDMQKI